MSYVPFKDLDASTIIKQLEIDLSPDSKPSKPIDYIAGQKNIDLTHVNYLSLFDLMNLFLFIDMAHCLYGNVELSLIGISHHGKEPIPIDQYWNSKKDRKRKVLSDDELFSDNVYKFLSFLNHFGFFAALEEQRRFQKVTISGLNDNLLNKLYYYSAISEKASRVLPLIPIRTFLEVENIYNSNNITQWMSGLKPEILSAPVFRDGEFSRFFGYQLGRNIVEHAGDYFRGEYGALGGIAMRVLPARIDPWIADSFPKNILSLFKGTSATRGILEICVGDRGVGIYNSLKNSLIEKRNSYGLAEDVTVTDVIGFAFHELGTRKLLMQRTGGAHALSRILKSVDNYGGILRLRTAGREFIYDGRGGPFKRSDDNLSILPTSENDAPHPLGTQFQLLLPLSVVKSERVIIHKLKDSRRSPSRMRLVNVAAYFGKIAIIDNNVEARLHTLANQLMEYSSSILIVYDFARLEMNEDVVAAIISTQERVIRTHLCIGINCISVRLLRDKEKSDQSGYLGQLSAQHTLFPIMDTNNQVWWIGLGEHNYDDNFDQIFNGTEAYESLFDETIQLYYKSNPHLFCCEGISATECHWTCLINKEEFLNASSTSVQKRFQELLKRTGCILQNGWYQLPSKAKYVNTFIKSLPIIQPDESGIQVGELFTSAIRDITINSDNNFIFMCATAPAELLARRIADTLPGMKIRTINLGYYASLNEDSLLRLEDLSAPVLIISDVKADGKTVGAIERMLFAMNKKPLAILTLLRFVSHGPEDEIKILNNWDPPPGGDSEKVPEFVVAEIREPKSLEHSEAVSAPQSLWLVEPFSLEEFSFQSLMIDTEGGRAKEQVLLMDRIGALRAGHWVYGSHHFRVVTSIADLLGNDSIAGAICQQIIAICNDQKIDNVIMPLHSLVGDIRARILSAFRVIRQKEIDISFAIETRVLTKRPFYLLPITVRQQIEVHAHKMQEAQARNARIDGLKILIVDDAIATGRTFETLFRAIILRARDLIREYKLKRSPVSHIHFYVIIDRQGRAKETTFKSIARMSVQSANAKDEDYTLTFTFDQWITLDMPVEEKGSCDICDEREELISVTQAAELPEDHRIITEIRHRIEETTARSTQADQFFDYKARNLEEVVKIGRFEVGTLELALWEFHNLSSRGCPIRILVEICHDVWRKIQKLETRETPMGAINLQELLAECIRLLFVDWKRVTGQWLAPSFIDLLLDIISSGNYLARIILSEAGSGLAKASKAKDLLERLATAALEVGGKISNDDDPEYYRRQHLSIGLGIYILRHAHVSRMLAAKVQSSQRTTRLEGILEKINTLQTRDGGVANSYWQVVVDELKQLILRVTNKENFLPAFIYLVDHTVRASRNWDHPHLLPNLLSRIAKGRPGQLSKESEKALLIDVLGLFLYCIKTTNARFFSLFSDEAKAIIPILCQRIEDVRSSLEKERKNQGYTSLAVSSVRKLLRIFPHQRTNSIYESIAKTQISLQSLIIPIKEECEQNGREWINHIPTGYENIFIIGPSDIELRNVLRNYTCQAHIDSVFCKRPRICFSLEERNTSGLGKRILISIYTNFQPKEALASGNLFGPGILSFDRQDFVLYRIQPEKELGVMGPDGIEYTLKFSIEISRGFNPAG